MTQPARITDQLAGPDARSHVPIAVAPPTPLANNVWTYRFAIITLGGLALLALAGALVLTAFGHEAPQVTVALGSAAVGALAGVLTPTPGRSLPRRACGAGCR